MQYFLLKWSLFLFKWYFCWCDIRLQWFAISSTQFDCASLHLTDATFVAYPLLEWVTYSSIPLRSISLMRHSSHQIKKEYAVVKASFPYSIFFFYLYVTHCLRTKKKYHPRQFNVRNGTRKCASRGSNPAHPESPRAFYISLLCIILCYKNARNPFVYQALRAI